MLLEEQGVPKDNIVDTTWGVMVEQHGIRVRPVESHHRSNVTLKDGTILSGVPLGFIIYLEDGIRVYNSSDTAIFGDLKLIGELYKPHVGLLNVTFPELDPSIPGLISTSLTGEMTPYEAALAAQWLNLDYAIACHYTHNDSADVKHFVELMERMRVDNVSPVKPIALASGEEFVYSRGNSEESAEFLW
jgi:L-ascorbate metabolism protein UlaG (beta-lactamase superfamily)